MGVPSDKLMELMRGSRSAGAEAPAPSLVPSEITGNIPGSPSMSEDSTPPMSSPMSTPEPKMGSKEAAMINVGMAMDLLEQSLPALGSESVEGQKALAAIRSLTGLMGPRKNKTNELQQSEILQMLQTLPQAGGASPEGRAMASAPIPGMPSPGAPQPPPM
jgi:hypothetical protein